jgi:hypothetical protein
MIHSVMRHPNIIRLYDYAESDQEYQLYMEYAERSDYLCQKILEVRIILYVLCCESLKISYND